MFYFEELSNSTKNKRVMKSDLLNVNHFFTTRETVIKSDESDMQKQITQNLDLIKNTYGISSLIKPIQTHSDNVKIVSNLTDEHTKFENTDALITTHTPIYLNFADCTPIIIYDEIKHVGAIVHAGWRGTATSIAPKTIQKMVSEFDCSPNDISAVIGPAIGICCYEVGDDVFNKLASTINTKLDSSSKIFTEKHGKKYVDLKALNACQLKEFGIEKIDICPYCTSCDNDLFFSYRKENGTTNRHSAVLIP